MRIRSIRPEFWSSEDVAELDWHTRLVFIGLWSYVDDNGVGRDVEKLIVAALFPLDDDQSESSRRVAAGILALQKGGQVTRYEVDGKPYLHITSWSKHQRTDNKAKDRYPLPTSTNAVSTPVAPVEPEVSPRIAADRGYGEGEKGRRGEEQLLLSDESDEAAVDRFDEFWRHYPRKDDKIKARKAWDKLIRKVDPQEIIDGLTAYKFNPDRQYQPLPTTWLNGQRWADEQAQTRLFDANQLPAPGMGWAEHQLDMVLGKDDWKPAPCPPGTNEQEWNYREKTLYRAKRIAAANKAVGRAA